MTQGIQLELRENIEFRGITLHCMIDGQPITSRSPLCPTPLKWILSQYNAPFGHYFIPSILSSLKVLPDFTLSITAQTGSYNDLKCIEHLKIDETLDFDLVNQTVRCTVCADRPVAFWSSLIIDIDNKAVAPYKRGVARTLFDKLFQFQATQPSFTMPIKTFNTGKLVGSADFMDPIRAFSAFFVEGKPAELMRPTLSTVIDVEINVRTATVILSPTVQHGDLTFCVPSVLRPYLDNIEYYGGPSMKAQFRKKLFAKLLLDLAIAETPKEKKQIIAASFKEMKFLHSWDRTQVRDILKDFELSLEDDTDSILVLNRQWTLLRSSNSDLFWARAVLAKAYPVSIFEVFSYDEVEISLNDFFKFYPTFEALCEQHHIAINCDTPLVHESLQIEVDASKDGAIDWFEVRPDVFLHANRIGDDHWQAILETGYYQNSEGITLLDASSLERLRHLMNVMPKKKAKTTEIVPVSRLAILDWIALRKSGIEVKLNAATEAIFESLLNFTHIPEQTLPKTLTADLRPYQHQGVNWLLFLYEHRFGAVLADDMGLGKTVQAIAFIALLKPTRKKPILIIVPPTLVFNWKHEFDRFLPSVHVLEYIGLGRDKAALSRSVVTISSYDIARRDLDEFKAIHYDVIIFDEAQAIKNISAQRTAAVRQLKGAFKLCLTGTPVENHVGEYFSILDLAVSGIFGEHKHFMKDAKNEVELLKYLERVKPFVLRRTKKEILKELPDKIESDIYLELSDRQKALYIRVVAEVRETVAKAFKYQPQQQAGIVALTALLRLRQICVAPQLVVADEKELSPKFEYLIDKLTELAQEGHSALIFSQFRKCLDLFSAALQTAGIDHLRMDGETPMAKRRELVKDYQSGKSAPFFLVSLKTGGVGLNLTRASYVIHIDPWWNPSVENQASDRAHRIGQTQTVHVFRLIMTNTVEEKIMLLKANKQKLVDQIMDGNTTSKAGAISREDFDYLLG